MNKVDQFMKHMVKDNWIFEERVEEQNFTFKVPMDVEQDCKTILLEQVYARCEEDGGMLEDAWVAKHQNVTPEELYEMLGELYEEPYPPELIHDFPFINLFLHVCVYWAELQAGVWAGIEGAGEEVIELGERMIDALMKIQKVVKVKDLGFDT